MQTTILKLDRYLVAALPSALTDTGWQRLRDDLLGRVSSQRAQGVVIDVSAVDVMDSYATRLLDGIAQMLSLRGAAAVVVGIRPAVAFAMSQLGLKLSSAGTALDLEDALAQLPGLVTARRR